MQGAFARTIKQSAAVLRTFISVNAAVGCVRSGEAILASGHAQAGFKPTAGVPGIFRIPFSAFKCAPSLRTRVALPPTLVRKRLASNDLLRAH